MQTSLNETGYLPCLIVHADQKHVPDIWTLLNTLRDCLSEKRYRPELLSDETPADHHFGETFERLADQCALAIIVLDGMRPNVLYEYGYLRAKGKPIILVQSKNARVSIKTLYRNLDLSTENPCKEMTGLTRSQFNNMKEPFIGQFDHFSDRQGINTLIVDSSCRWDHQDHPNTKLLKELSRITPQIVEKYSAIASPPLSDAGQAGKVDSLIQKITRYYTEYFDDPETAQILTEIEGFEKQSITLPPGVYGMAATLFSEMAKKVIPLKVSRSVEYSETALFLYDKVLNGEADEAVRAETFKKKGNLFLTIAQVENKAENCARAIECYKSALEIYTDRVAPFDYASTQNALASAYTSLGEVRDRAFNARQALEALNEALKVYKADRYKKYRAAVYNNIGRTNRILGEAESISYVRKAIVDFKEALSNCDQKGLSEDFATVQNNLGNSFLTLAQYENKGENAKKAIAAFKDALMVYKPQTQIRHYARVQNNLANAYFFLAGAENPKENGRLALKACAIALKFRTLEEYRREYATTRTTQGLVYAVLGRATSNPSYYERAIEAHKEALSLFENESLQWAETYTNLGEAYLRFGDHQKDGKLISKALDCFNKSLTVYTFEKYPLYYGNVESLLGQAYATKATLSGDVVSRQQSSAAFREALKVFNKKVYPERNAAIREFVTALNHKAQT